MSTCKSPGRWLALAAALVLLACTSPPSNPPASMPILEPNANLVVQGIPPIPARLVDDVAKYTDFRGHGFVDWHPTQREMLVAHRQGGGDTAQLFRLRGPMQAPEQLTDFADPVVSASYEPRDGHYLVYERNAGGSEADQIYRLDPDTRASTLLTDPAERHSMQGWLHRQSLLLVASLPLDRTAEGGTRTEVATTFRLIDPAQPGSARVVAQLPGGGWYAGGVSWDDRQVALTRYLSANESQVWLLDLQTGQTRQVLPAPSASPGGSGATASTAPSRATHFASGFMPDNQRLLVVSDRAGEFRELMALTLADGRLHRVTGHIPWDVSGVSVTEDGRRIAVQANVEGRDELRLFDGGNYEELAPPRLPPGSVGSAVFHRRMGELAFSINSAQGPSQIHTLSIDSGATRPWTEAYAPPGIDMRRFTDQQIVRWKSFDGLTISGLLNMPPPSFTGKRPVIVLIHGGPEAQATMGFMGRYNYFLNELGIAVIQPNVRGSSGYGKTFLTLDNGKLREDPVRDIGALLDWIATQPQLDASRVLVTGGSYGGYMALAVSTHEAERIAGAISVVGISNFVTFLENTESYRRDLRRVEYGDERDPAMRAFLQSISPLTHAHKITKPLFVVQGKNDPRVPYTEAEQIVARAREVGTPVWYLRADNEGHGFARKENADFQFYATIQFLRETLLRR